MFSITAVTIIGTVVVVSTAAAVSSMCIYTCVCTLAATWRVIRNKFWF